MITSIKNKIQYIRQPEIQTNIAFYTYIHQCAKNMIEDSFSDDAKLNLDF